MCAIFLRRLRGSLYGHWCGTAGAVCRLKTRESSGEVFLRWGVARVKRCSGALGLKGDGRRVGRHCRLVGGLVYGYCIGIWDVEDV